jgi:hypothetical protein
MIEGGDDRPGRNRKQNMLWDICINKYTGRSCFKQQLINKTGAASVYGEVIIASTTTDFAFDQSGVDEDMPIGIVYEAGIADGSLCWVVIYGSAQVLLKDTTASTHGNWVYTADAAGRADATLAGPPGGAFPQIDNHMRELGHCLESQGAGTDVLAEIDVHLN